MTTEEIVTAIIGDVCELPDYTSPDDQPDLLQCRVHELKSILQRHLSARPEALCITDHEIRSLYRGGFDAYWHGELNQGRAPNNDTAFIHGIKAVLSARPEAREGWKLVPITPTWAMQCAGNETGCFEDDYPRQAQKEAKTVYEAMLAAAPSFPSPLRRSAAEPLRLCGCPGACQGYATLPKGVTCSMHVPESIARPPQRERSDG